MKKFFLLLSVLLVWMSARGESVDSLPRPVTSVYALEYGAGSALSTYLSPLRYHGSSVSASGQWTKALPVNPEKLVMQFNTSLDFKSMLNKRQTAQMIGFDAGFNWNILYRIHPADRLQVAFGGGPSVEGGVLYVPRNGNNPVSANAALSIDVSASASWRMKIGRLPVLISDRVRLPSLGVFFSPQYGETYYEIYLGNHSGLAHCGWWGNRFGIDNLLSIDLDFGRTAMRIGYRYRLQTQWVCDLNTQVSSHALVLGVIPQGLGLKKKRKAVYGIY